MALPQDYYQKKYPFTWAAHQLEIKSSFGLAGGNGGPKDEEVGGTFSDSSGRQYTAQSYNEMHEAKLVELWKQGVQPQIGNWG